VINVDVAIARSLARFPSGYAVYPTRCQARRVVAVLVSSTELNKQALAAASASTTSLGF